MKVGEGRVTVENPTLNSGLRIHSHPPASTSTFTHIYAHREIYGFKKIMVKKKLGWMWFQHR